MLRTLILLSSLFIGSEADKLQVIGAIEVNHCYNQSTGKKRFIQIILWDYYPGDERLHVREWTMYCPKKHTFFTTNTGFYYFLNSNLNMVKSRTYKVTHTYIDPEEEDRRLLPVDARRAVSKR